jgi:[ribosomal protein S5]-alanine N-acetyltransferase
MILRDMTEADLDILFDIQDDDIAQHMAGFTSPARGDRDNYVARQRRFLADDRITNKVILVNDDIAGSVASFVVEGDTEVTSWIRRDLWGRGIATAALGELLREVMVRRCSRGSRPTTPARRRCCYANGFTQIGEETSYADARAAEVTEHIYRLDDPSAE